VPEADWIARGAAMEKEARALVGRTDFSAVLRRWWLSARQAWRVLTGDLDRVDLAFGAPVELTQQCTGVVDQRSGGSKMFLVPSKHVVDESGGGIAPEDVQEAARALRRALVAMERRALTPAQLIAAVTLGADARRVRTASTGGSLEHEQAEGIGPESAVASGQNHLVTESEIVSRVDALSGRLAAALAAADGQGGERVDSCTTEPLDPSRSGAHLRADAVRRAVDRLVTAGALEIIIGEGSEESRVVRASDRALLGYYAMPVLRMLDELP
jgi:hypothetical protein